MKACLIKPSFFLSLLLLQSAGFALEVKPWFGNVYEFEFIPTYSYSRFTKVQHAVKPLKSPSNDQLLAFDLEFTPSECWNVEVEMEFAHTPRQRWGYRSAALQVREQWLNDVAGDPISLTTGLNIREVSDHSLKDISSPYHARFDVELNLAIGKEWHQECQWTYRIFGFEGIGIGNKGSPWSRTELHFERNWDNHHHAQLFFTGYFGMGSERRVDINHFHGWGKIRHQSLEIGAGYRYRFNEWAGSICFDGLYRYFARSYPENAFFLIFSYRLPFCYF